jgi:hypothetical protein
MDQPSLKCPHCGAPIFATDDECLACGTHLHEGQLVAAPGEPPPPAPAQPVEAAPLNVEVPPADSSPRPVHYQTAPGAQPWDPTTLGTGGDFFTRLSRGWSFMGQALSLLGRDARLVVPSILAVLAEVGLVGVTLLIVYLTGHWTALWHGDKGQREMIMWAMLLPLSFCGYLVTYFFQGMTVELVAAILRGQAESVEMSAADCCRDLPSLTLLAMASFVVSLVLGALRGNNRSLVRDAAANAAASAWHVVVLLALPVIVLERLPFIAAFKRAGELHRRHLGDVLISWGGVGVVNQVIGTVTMLLAIAIAYGFYSIAAAAAIPFIIGWILLLVLAVSVFTSYLNTAYYTCLYLWAAATEQATEPVPAPAPLAALAW